MLVRFMVIVVCGIMETFIVKVVVKVDNTVIFMVKSKTMVNVMVRIMVIRIVIVMV